MIDVMKAKRAYEGKFAVIDEIIKQVPQLVDANWIAERKFDGTRAILTKEGTEIRFETRTGKTNLEERFPEIINEATKINYDSFILDGELTFYKKDGKEIFITARMTEETKASFNAIYWVFDIIEANGLRFENYPLMRRVSEVRVMLTKFSDNLHFIKQVEQHDNKIALLNEAFKNGEEGIMLKNKMSKYEQGVRSSNWLKVKHEKSTDVIVMGWIPGDEKKILETWWGSDKNNSTISDADFLKNNIRMKTFGALKCYQYDKNGTLLEVCNVGGGFTNDVLMAIKEKYLLPDGKVFDKFIIEIKYLNMTEDGHYRMPNFLRLRPDKPLKDCIIEKEIKRGDLGRWMKC